MSAGDWKELFRASCSGDLALVVHHLRAGVDPDHVHPEILSTPLVTAILAGHAAIALVLLEHGADPALCSEFDGLTPLQAARQAGLREVEQRLLVLGVADADVRRPVPWWKSWLRPGL